MESELLIVARQRDRSCTFEIEGLVDNFWVVRFSGSEGLSSLYEFQLEVVARHIEVGELVGRDATLRMAGTAEPRLVHGLILRAEYAGELRPRALYRLTLVPSLYKLLLRTDCRIFQRCATPEILKQVLEGAGIARAQVRFELNGSYAPRDYCVQYRESDFQFISRLMEEEGIVYFFEHAADKHVLVLTDRAGGAKPLVGGAELPFRAPGGMVRDREHVKAFRMSEEIRPSQVALRDFNLHRPDDPLEVSHQAAGQPPLELYDYPGEYQEPPLGQRLAKVELEAAQVTRRVGRGDSDSPRLTPGLAFSLTGHPRIELDGEYCVVRVHHSGEQPGTLDHTAVQELVYRNEFTCIPSEVPYRAPRATSRPTMRGVQTAMVVGPEGEEVHVDEHGRVKIQFHWDRAGKSDELSSCWVRVSQMWAGNGFGAMFIPRIGHEVIVDFIEGDPDRPIIIGRVYHGLNAPPYPLPDEKSKSTIKTETFKGGGYNELRFEDAKGGEQVFVHAQRDLDLCVRNDRRDGAGRDMHETVIRDRLAKVGGDAHAEVVGTSTTKIGGAVSVDLGAKVDVAVAGGLSVGVDEDVALSIGGAQHVEIGRDHHVTTGGDSVLAVSGAASTKVTGAVVVEAGTTLVLKASAGITLQGPGGFITIDASGVSIQGTMLLLNSGGAALPGTPSPATTPSAPTVATPTTPTPAEKTPTG